MAIEFSKDIEEALEPAEGFEKFKITASFVVCGADEDDAQEQLIELIQEGILRLDLEEKFPVGTFSVVEIEPYNNLD